MVLIKYINSLYLKSFKDINKLEKNKTRIYELKKIMKNKNIIIENIQ